MIVVVCLLAVLSIFAVLSFALIRYAKEYEEGEFVGECTFFNIFCFKIRGAGSKKHEPDRRE